MKLCAIFGKNINVLGHGVYVYFAHILTVLSTSCRSGFVFVFVDLDDMEGDSPV